MCRRVTCRNCGRPTWAGCGAHVEQVIGDVPESDRCHCRESTSQHGTAPSAEAGKSWLSRLLGR